AVDMRSYIARGYLVHHLDALGRTQLLVQHGTVGREEAVAGIGQMKEITALTPNDATHKAFGDALRFAAAEGVNVLAVDCTVTKDRVDADQFIPVIL
ncbi:MAG: DNA/RNA nuclease SfsA, partial [Clostridia bacterium]|nr:DNA/RNA nuclease SfsA [Clostridia bacterium]